MRITIDKICGNYYGGLCVKEEDGKFFASITDYDGDEWDEIPKSLFDELIKFQEEDQYAKR